MQFTLIDRITDVQPGASITAVRALSLAGEYLQDHFPRFPVMSGVLMIMAVSGRLVLERFNIGERQAHLVGWDVRVRAEMR